MHHFRLALRTTVGVFGPAAAAVNGGLAPPWTSAPDSWTSVLAVWLARTARKMDVGLPFHVTPRAGTGAPGPQVVRGSRWGPSRATRDFSGDRLCAAATVALMDDAQASHHIREGWRVAGLSGGENEREWSAAGVGREVHLRGRSAPGPTGDVVVRLAAEGPLSSKSAPDGSL